MRAARRISRERRGIIDRAIDCVMESLEDRRLLSGNPIYVDMSATGTGNGTSWANAYTNLQSALSAAQTMLKSSPGTNITIDVAQGIYVPTDTEDTSASFQLLNNVSLEGGYGGEKLAEQGGDPNTREVYGYATVLSGDIGGDEAASSVYSTHVVTATDVNQSAVLYGFTIVSGNAGSGTGGGLYDKFASPTVNYCQFNDDTAANGGAIGNYASSPAIINCTFLDDHATGGGGAISNQAAPDGGAASAPTISGCMFVEDSGGDGGAIENDGSSPTISYCRFSGDMAANDGGAIDNNDASPMINYCTFLGDGAASGGAVYDGDSSSPEISYSAFTGDYATDRGGAIVNGNLCSPTISTSNFTGDTADIGGAIENEFCAPTISGCTFNGDSAGLFGGAISEFSSAATITYCNFSGDGAPYGGAIDNYGYTPSANINCCQFTDDTAVEHGGAICNHSSSPAISLCKFSGDGALSGGAIFDGAAFYAQFAGQVTGGSQTYSPGHYSAPTITSCTFYGDQATSGGAIYNARESAPTISQCTFDGANATKGGAIYDGLYSSPSITACAFYDNHAGDGGAIYNLNYAAPTVANCLFTGDSADELGGAIDDADQAVPTIVNCTLYGDAAVAGGAIYNGDSLTMVSNCIIWGDGPDALGGRAGRVSNSDVEQSGFAGHDNNIDSDPVFVSSADLELQRASPCVDAGSNSAVPEDLTADFAGNPRISDGIVDMGAYEFVFPAFTSAQSTTFTVGDAGSITISTTGFRPLNEAIVTSGMTPAALAAIGLTFIDNGDGTATLSGTPAAGTQGIYQLSFIAGSGSSAAMQSFTLTVVTDATWTGGGGDANWNDPNNWSPAVVPNQLNDIIIGSSFSGETIVVPAGTFAVHSLNSDASLTIDNQATLSLYDDSVLTGVLTIQPEGTLDVTNASLAINYGVGHASPVSLIEMYLARGYDGGAWNGTGIVSSTAAANPGVDSVGYADGSVDAGTPATPGEVLIKYTRAGDANLDGATNFNDLSALGKHLNTTGNDWAEGNFNYSPVGAVNFTDLMILGQNLNQQVSPAASAGETLGGTTLPLGNLGAVVTGEAGAVPAVTGNLYNPTADSAWQLPVPIDPATDLLNAGSGADSLLNN